ncbi:AraC-type DNA-binding protein [Paenibacillus sp. UNCCL117]|uniref:AraC family transcriptional regulator n=1 Tax=unclassified Paenibacillus TaxID=185978 RepID=UPI000882E790|nr:MULTISPECIES: AraC family transcriptional regulator [unclassified Paenibacillus]SDE46743.1 AraC-type DNA-binding protein [Paenibacillus sp. cl123]SFW65801.1 AraC-type DNA-binding protein [Paenibacillus sp. UNCCL117]
MPISNVIRLEYPEQWGGYKTVYHTPYHLLMLMDQGSCAYWIDGARYEAKPGEVLYMRAAAPRAAEPSASAHRKYSVHWTGDAMDEHFPPFKQLAVLFRSAPLASYLRLAYQQLYQLWTRKDPYYRASCEALLLEIAVRLHQEQAADPRSGKQARIVRQVKDYILDYYCEPLSIEELAELVGRNPSHLITSFKKHYGMAPIEFMHRTRIARAEELLLTTDATIEAIADQLGYCDASYLSRIFKKWTGTTLSAYRRQRWD